MAISARTQLAIREFELDLDKISDKLGIAIGSLTKKFVFDLNGELVFTTPVKTGRARGSWNVSLDFAEFIDSGPQPAMKGIGSPAMVPVPNVSVGDDPFRQWHLANGIEYVFYLDQGMIVGTGPKSVNGYSLQAPAGIVDISINAVAARYSLNAN